MAIGLDIDWNPDERKLRRFGWFTAVAALAAMKFLPPVAAMGAAAVGALSALLSLARPRANRPLYLALTVVTWPIGFAVSTVMLALLFFGVITPIGLVLRWLGQDPMRRRSDRSAGSYWVQARRERPAQSYFRQY
jgi:hypothetical protein